ncbi:MAG: Holliday junction resolvase RuvX [Chloroflexi bacterium]|nr:Holliday junction resolvase RuvX [Chloroflexota bacterium]
MGRVLGLDLGEKRIGLAVSDPTGLLVVDSWVLERQTEGATLDSLAKLCQERQVERIVVGLPRSLEGGLGPQAQLTLDFVHRLAERVALPVDTWDERLSTVAAERALRESGMRREKRRQHRDAVAAALLLQSYLDRSILRSAGAP